MTTTREWRRQYHLERYHDLRQRIIAHLGGKCVVCGAIADLQVHHKERRIKAFNISKSWGRPWPVIIDELKKCELRCSQHHKAVHQAQHGTISGYRCLRCRCERCRLAWNAATRRWQQAQRDRGLAKRKGAGL